MRIENVSSYLSIFGRGEDQDLLSDAQPGLWHQVNDTLAHLAEAAFSHTRVEVATNDGMHIAVESRAVLPLFQRGLLFSGFDGVMRDKACLLIEPVLAGEWQLRIMYGEQNEFVLSSEMMRGPTQQELAYVRRVLVPVLQRTNREYLVS